MASRGRKPTPTHLKLIKGVKDKNRINQKEPEPKGDLFEAPDWLTEDQRAGWTYAIANIPSGLLKRVDCSVLTVWVVAQDMHRRACELQARLDATSEAPMLSETPNKMQVQSPYLAIINRQATIMLRTAEQMGFTPVSRTRISMDGTEAFSQGDPATDEFFD